MAELVEKPLYRRKCPEQSGYDPVNVIIRQKVIHKQYLEESMQKRRSISVSLSRIRNEWLTKQSPYTENLTRILIRPRPMVTQPEWDPCLDFEKGREKRQQMLHNEATLLEGKSVRNSVIRPKSAACPKRQELLYCAEHQRPKTGVRRMSVPTHNLLTPDLLPKRKHDHEFLFYRGEQVLQK